MLLCNLQRKTTMGKLKGSQRRYLRGAAHSYRPSVQIGRDGLTDGVVAAIDAALTAHELVKVKIAADRTGRDTLVPAIEDRLCCECVGTLGHTAVLYRQHPDPEKRTLEVPG
jgi:RNA-binding protein